MVALLIAALAVVGAANWWSRATTNRLVEAITKPSFTVLAALLCLAHGSGSARAIAVVAFGLCLVGDIALLPAIDKFIVGLGAFLAGHVAFTVALVVVGIEKPPVLAAVAGFLLTPLLRGPGQTILRRSGKLRGPVTIYLAVISVMALTAWATARPAALVGGAAFVASDTLLGWGKFVSEKRWMPVAVMVTYHVALVGLALSFG